MPGSGKVGREWGGRGIDDQAGPSWFPPGLAGVGRAVGGRGGGKGGAKVLPWHICFAHFVSDGNSPAQLCSIGCVTRYAHDVSRAVGLGMKLHCPENSLSTHLYVRQYLPMHICFAHVVSAGNLPAQFCSICRPTRYSYALSGAVGLAIKLQCPENPL